MGKDRHTPNLVFQHIRFSNVETLVRQVSSPLAWDGRGAIAGDPQRDASPNEKPNKFSYSERRNLTQ